MSSPPVVLPETKPKKARVRAPPKAPRQPRFDPDVPANLFRLADVWKYRDHQRRSLNKTKTLLRDGDPTDQAQQTKLAQQAERYERNLEQLEANLHDAYRQVLVATELLRAGVKIAAQPAAELSGWVEELVAVLAPHRQTRGMAHSR